MMFQTQNQLNLFLIFIFLGIVFSTLFCVIKIFFSLKNRKNILKNVILAIFFAFFSIFFMFLLFFLNNGKSFVTLSLSTFCGFIWSNQSFSKIVVKLEKKWYTLINKTKKDNLNESSNKS